MIKFREKQYTSGALKRKAFLERHRRTVRDSLREGYQYLERSTPGQVAYDALEYTVKDPAKAGIAVGTTLAQDHGIPIPTTLLLMGSGKITKHIPGYSKHGEKRKELLQKYKDKIIVAADNILAPLKHM